MAHAHTENNQSICLHLPESRNQRIGHNGDLMLYAWFGENGHTQFFALPMPMKLIHSPHWAPFRMRINYSWHNSIGVLCVCERDIGYSEDDRGTSGTRQTRSGSSIQAKRKYADLPPMSVSIMIYRIFSWINKCICIQCERFEAAFEFLWQLNNTQSIKHTTDGLYTYTRNPVYSYTNTDSPISIICIHIWDDLKPTRMVMGGSGWWGMRVWGGERFETIDPSL